MSGDNHALDHYINDLRKQLRDSLLKNARYEKALKDVLEITEDTIELEVFADIVEKALND